jgi:hypothetical protein
LGDKKSKEFALCGRHGRESRDWLGVIIAIPATVVLNWQAKLVPHVINIPLDGLAGYLQMPGNAGAIGILSFQ